MIRKNNLVITGIGNNDVDNNNNIYEIRIKIDTTNNIKGLDRVIKRTSNFFISLLKKWEDGEQI